MCGIAGAIGPPRPEDAEALTRQMVERLHHRGPDEHRVESGRGWSLGMARLRIIGSRASQPFVGRSGRVLAVVNGEIYNEPALRVECEANGYRFRTDGDCEVVLALYELHGVCGLERLRGMYAYAIVDDVARTLILGRDPLGEKPLYYSAGPDGLLFCSELTAIRGPGGAPHPLNRSAVADYLRYGYISEPATILEGVEAVPAGEVLSVGLDDAGRVVRRNLTTDILSKLDIDIGTTTGPEILEPVIDGMARTEVPAALCLSGGLDSYIVGQLLRKRNRALTAVVVHYPDREYPGEPEAARLSAAELDLPLDAVCLTSAQVAADFPELVNALDSPVADLASPAYFALARHMHLHGYRVAYLGHGPDELFWGYRWPRLALGQDATTPEQVYGSSETVRVSDAVARHMYGDSILDVYGGTRTASAVAHTGCAGETILRALVAWYLRSNGLAQVDRLFMHWSVEARSPLVDVGLLAAALSVARSRAGPPSAKAAFRHLFRELRPARTVEKTPFLTPAVSWHRSVRLHHDVRFEDSALAALGILSRDGARTLDRDTTYGLESGVSIWWKAAVLEVWLRQRGLCNA